MNVNARIDDAVIRLRRLGVEIVTADGARWVAELEDTWRIKLTPAYRSLIARYRFRSFVAGPVELFGNDESEDRSDVRHAPFADSILASWMTKNGYFQVGRSSDDSYDPIAVRQQGQGPARDPMAVARFPHEAILMEESTVDPVDSWSSFIDLLDLSVSS